MNSTCQNYVMKLFKSSMVFKFFNKYQSQQQVLSSIEKSLVNQQVVVVPKIIADVA